MSQSVFAARCGLFQSKLSRLVSGKLTPERETLDIILDNVPDGAMRTKLVAAYFKDLASPGALLHLKSRTGDDPYAELWRHLELDCMSVHATAAFKALIRSDHRHEVEEVLKHLAKIAGLRLDLVAEVHKLLGKV